MEDKAADKVHAGVDKGKSVMIEQALPTRTKSKQELELERISE